MSLMTKPFSLDRLAETIGKLIGSGVKEAGSEAPL
jgi:hypothetical protein